MRADDFVLVSGMSDTRAALARWNAATFVTVGIAIPILVAAATWEVYLWLPILRAVSPIAPL